MNFGWILQGEEIFGTAGPKIAYFGRATVQVVVPPPPRLEGVRTPTCPILSLANHSSD